MLYEDSKDKSEELGRSDKVMEEYIKESNEVINLSFEESYDHEMAAKEANYEEGFEEGIKKGKVEGIIEGKLEGKKEESITIAKKMIEKNIDIESIAYITGLSKKELKS